MTQDRIRIEYDEPTNWVGFECEMRGGLSERDGFHLPAGFTILDVLNAVIATGLIVETADGLFCEQPVRCGPLRQLVTEMFSYFHASEKPTRQLVQIKYSVESQLVEVDSELTVSLWTCAWLDVMVREDLADVARGLPDLWSRDQVSLGIDEIRRRRLLEWKAKSVASNSELRMAASSRSRESLAKARLADRDGTRG